MNARSTFPKTRYPGKVAIRHVIEAARSLGLDVVGIEVTPDGTIRALDRKAIPAEPMDEFAKWDAAGKL